MCIRDSPISFEDIPGGAKGFFSPVESRIAIQEGMSEIQTVKTAIHEIAHAKLHAVKPDEKYGFSHIYNISIPQVFQKITRQTKYFFEQFITF